MSLNGYFISVGEPWDFDSPDGPNIINGTIFKIISNTCLIFKANYELKFSQAKGDLFVLFPRYLEDNFRDLSNGKEHVVVNGNLISNSDFENENEEALKEKSSFVIAGAIRKITSKI